MDTRRRPNPDRTKARNAKKAGMKKADYIAFRVDMIEAAAKQYNWRASERAATIADVHMIADEVWGK